MAEAAKRTVRQHGRRILCGVPVNNCNGTLVTTPNKGVKVHVTPDEAFRCMERYLISQGFKKVGNREFETPGGGPIRVLTKRSRFGCAFRPGKEGRWMQEHTGGYIVSC